MIRQVTREEFTISWIIFLFKCDVAKQPDLKTFPTKGRRKTFPHSVVPLLAMARLFPVTIWEIQLFSGLRLLIKCVCVARCSTASTTVASSCHKKYQLFSFYLWTPGCCSCSPSLRKRGESALIYYDKFHRKNGFVKRLATLLSYRSRFCFILFKCVPPCHHYMIF